MQVVSHFLPRLVTFYLDYMLNLVGLSGSTYIEFDNVEVPASNRLGEENKGFHIIMNSKYATYSPQ